jgi:hypothetical protein
MMERSDGWRARVCRALFPQLRAGLPRDVVALYWGVWSILLVPSVFPWRVKLVLGVIALAGHGLLAYLSKDDPFRLLHLKRKWQHADRYTPYCPRRPR